MNGPITLYALRLLRQNHRLKARGRQLLADLAVADELADVALAQRDEAVRALRDLETLHGWLGSEAT